jgi:Tol biopolymer transport system component
MGEVYRARDTKLQRDVAIKVLPEALAHDSERLARFEREARTLASLNHPHIGQIYGLEESDGIKALVMELVEGPTLADRIAQGPIPLDEALPIAKQIAEALEAAHEQGIIHRDLKPANVKVRPDGMVKVLDFGLAKALEASPVGSDVSQSPTITSPAMTGLGVILGTAAYMSPEQARGKAVDRRTDIWALGAVLFEMLTGRRIYKGETVTDTLAQVLTHLPRWDLLPPATPAAIRRILGRCLEKDPRGRLQAAGDVRIEIEECLASPGGQAADRVRWSSRSAQLWPWGVAVVLAILLVLAIWKLRTPSSAAPPPLRLLVSLGAGEQLVVNEGDDGALPVLSPDGQMLVYAGTSDSVRRLYVRPLDSLESRALSGTEAARSHFFSPDGRWIAFFADDMLKKVAVTGGAPVPIASALQGARGGTWGPDDTIVFTPTPATGLYRVAAAGGTPVEITKLAEKERTHRWPWFLPDGSAVIFVRQDQDAAYDDGVIEAVRLDTAERKILIRGGTFPRYLASGHLVYVRGNTLFAVPFDAKRLEVQGNPQPVLSGVLSSGGVGYRVGNGASQIAFSSNGTVVYIAGSALGAYSRLGIVDRSGTPLFTYPEKGEFSDPRFSPDGARIALQMGDGKTSHLYVLNVDRQQMTKVTFDGTYNGLPVWSPDGQQLAYCSDRVSGGVNVFLRRSDGAGEPEALTTGDGIKLPSSFSPDGRLLLVMQAEQGSAASNLGAASYDVAVLSLADKQVTPLTATPATELLPAFSPDGRWVAYQSVESGMVNVYVRPYPGPGGPYQISARGGAMPFWTKGGHELVYLAIPTGNLPGPTDRFMAVEIAVEAGAFRPGKPQVLFEMPLAHPPISKFYDVSADGSRFVVLKVDENVAFTHVTLVLNFFDEVRRVLAGR